MGNATDGHIDHLVKARWLAMGLSQNDLAEVLGAEIKQAAADGKGSRAAAGRLKQIADALGFAPNSLRSSAQRRRHTRQENRQAPGQDSGRDSGQAPVQDPPSEQSGASLQSLLDLRLLRAFRELQDHRSKRMLVHLAERMVRRQANGQGDAG
jgi:transcriptional regulator with XRE-family HTH domain